MDGFAPARPGRPLPSVRMELGGWALARTATARAAAVAAALACVVVSVVGGPVASGAAQSAPVSAAVARDVGQMLVARFAGASPSPALLSAIHSGRVGGIILFGDNTGGAVAATRSLTARLQATAISGGNPRLLIMTDQEGGQVRRLAGPPALAASQMTTPSVAAAQGRATAEMLRSAGVNVDLAPVADVSEIDGFMTIEHRTFGSDPARVAAAACAFAGALAAGGVGYTLKHFPGLGDAVLSTDDAPVSVPAGAGLLAASDAAYRRCGSGPRALVMISSASYPHLTGSTPAVMSPAAYRGLASDRADAVTISDDLQAPALAGVTAPARTAINAGLDLALYAQTEAAAEDAYPILVDDIRLGVLSVHRVAAAAAAIHALKQSLGLLTASS